MKGIENARIDVYEKCLHQAVNYSNNSQRLSRQVVSSLSDDINKIGVATQHSHSMEGAKALLLDCYDQYWKTLSQSLIVQTSDMHLVWQDSSVIHNILKERSHLMYFFIQYRTLLKPAQKSMDHISHVKQRILDHLKMCEDPVIYYNVTEKDRYYDELSKMYSDYTEKKPIFEGYLAETNKILSLISKTNRQLCSEGEQILRGCNESLGRTNRYLEEILSWFLLTVIEGLNKFVQKLKHGDVQSALAIDKEEFRREYIHQFSKCKNMSRDEINSMAARAVKFTRKIMDNLIYRSKIINDALNEYFVFADDRLAHMKRSLHTSLHEIKEVSLMKEGAQLCPNSRILRRSLKSLDRILTVVLEFSSDIMRVSAMELKDLRIKTSSHLENVYFKLSSIMDRSKSLDMRQLLEFHNAIYIQLESLRQIESYDNKEFKHIMVKSLEKYGQNINQTCSQLRTQEPALKNMPAINIYEYIRNQMLSDIHTQNIIWDDHFQTKVSQALTHNFQFPQSQTVTAYGEGSYSCALGGKLILAGRMKLCDNIFCFESNFNKRNIFFGSTKIIVPKSQMVNVEAKTMMMLENSIQLQTKMGRIFLTSLFHRDQTLKEFEDMLNSGPDKDYIRDEKDEAQSVKSEVMTPDELKLVHQRELGYDAKLLEPLEIEVRKAEYPQVNLKTFYRLILSNNQARKGRKCYQNFRVMNLKESNNSEIKCSNLQPLAPSYFEKGCDIKLSDAKPSERHVTYKRKLPSMPIPFMPTHSNCSEKEKIHWISTTIVVIDKENTASGVPFADSFCVNERMIITQVGDNTVTAHMSYEIVFKPGASLKGILKSAADKQVKATAELFQKLSKEYIKEVKSRPKTKRSKRLPSINASVNEPDEIETPISKSPLDDIKIRLIICAAVLAIVLLIAGQLLK